LVTDARSIKRLIDRYAALGNVLPRSLQEIYIRVRDFWVAEAPGGQIAGCVALQMMWEDLAEVRSLVVDPEHQSHGIGRMLVRATLEEAKALGLRRAFALTEVPAFFLKLGFEEVEMDTLPQKVFYDCIHCPKLDHCNEVALIFDCSNPLPDKGLAKPEQGGLQSGF
jgi:amino-acid N-acetyltransferase